MSYLVANRDRHDLIFCPYPLSFIALSTIGSECIESAQYHTNLQPQGTQMVVPGAKVTFTCSANFPALYPLWEINSQTYRVTHLPPDYIATGSNLTIPIIMDTDVSCIFKKYLPEQGIVADICSNTATVKPFNIHGQFPGIRI